jgi:hypothetical protein
MVKWKFLYQNTLTECVKDLDNWSELLILESLLTTFKLSIVFKDSWGSSVNSSSLKSNHHKQI